MMQTKSQFNMESLEIISISILSIFFGIVVEGAFGPIVYSVVASAIYSTSKTYSWNIYANLEVLILGFIPFLLGFSGTIGVLSKLIKLW